MRNAETHRLGESLVKSFFEGRLDTIEKLTIALDNKWFRLNMLYMIKPKPDMEGEVPDLISFRPNWAQSHFWANKHNRNIILKARQLGFTTMEMMDALDTALFNAKSTIGVIAHNKGDAAAIFDDKIKVAYESVPEHWLDIMDAIGYPLPGTKTDRSGGYTFDNGSRLDVSTGYRGGTLKKLHISEYGKICKKYPLNAKEIKTGAMEAVPTNGELTIESTAEGQAGIFYELCKAAEKKALSDEKLTSLDFKFFFYPWWQCPDYVMPDEPMLFAYKDQEYFEEIEAKVKKTLSMEQKVWYIKKRETQRDDMKQEYPSTPDEAFEASSEGCYYAKDFAKLRKKNHILTIPYDPRLPVFTFWDLGRNDSTAIWFMQHGFGEYRFIDYLEDSGEAIQHYGRELMKKEYAYGTLYLPHDGEVVDLSSGDNKSRREILEGMGFRVVCVPRVPDKLEAIQAVRDILPMCWFDKTMCGEGIKALESFRKEWDDKKGTWKDKPLHDWASHGASAFEQFARGFSEAGDMMSYDPVENW